MSGEDDTDETEELEGDLVPVKKTARAERLEGIDNTPEVGSWWWVYGSRKKKELSDYDRDGDWLGCVVEVGSNYVKLKGVCWSKRISIDGLLECCDPEPNPDAFIRQKLEYHKGQVRELMGEVKRVCALLGIPMSQALASSSESSTTALAVAHGVDDVKAHKRALVKAKEKTLPELFSQVNAEHKEMAKWMHADLIPAEAELSRAKTVTEAIEGKIHTVELYAGLQEELVQVREGEPAEASTKVTLLQARRYMDEECLAQYEAGGMDFKSIRAFDKWIARDENMFRLLPYPRCVVAFRVRRRDKRYGGDVDTLANFIKFWQYNEANKHTFLYIRNGQQLWRMDTSAEFGEELFPRAEDSDLLGNAELWIQESEYGISHGHGIRSAARQADAIDSWRAERSYVAQCLRQWRRAGKPEGRDDAGKWTYVAVASEHEQYNWKPGSTHETEGDPRHWGGICRSEYDRAKRPDWRNWVQLTPENIYYDDVMKRVQKAAMEQNRVAVVLQGLLDRSTCLHPHPPWRIWTPEGFEAGVELVYDSSLAITAGEKPDWAGYLRQLAKSLKTGSHTIGQRPVWHAWASEHCGGGRDGDRVGYYYPSGAGPKTLDRVAKLWKDGTATFEFVRSRQKAKWVQHPEKRGYLKATYDDIPMSWRTPKQVDGEDFVLFCVDAYTPGDFHIFFDDPRTRAEYLQWAPYLLAAEDWHHTQRNPKKSKGDDE